MEIKTPEYQVWTDDTTVFFEGSMRLSGTEAYAPISDMLHAMLVTQPNSMELDLTGLEFLNSSGINMLAKFTIAVRKQPTTALRVHGSQRVPWQGKSLPNLKKLCPALELVVD